MMCKHLIQRKILFGVQILAAVFIGLPGAQAQSQFLPIGGDEINNGGGFAEKNFALAFQNLEHYIDLCLDSSACNLSADERDVLTAIRQGLPVARSINPHIIDFRSAKYDELGFFIDGHMKVARTGNFLGAPIYVNLDLIYQVSNLGQIVPLSIADAVAILVHEMGHQVGIPNHSFLDLLGAKVASRLNEFTSSTPALPFENNLALTAINDIEEDETGFPTYVFPRVYLYIYDQVLEITDQVTKAIGQCQEVTNFNGAPAAARGAFVYNIHWSVNGQDVSDFDGIQRHQRRYVIRGNLAKFCEGTNLPEDAEPSLLVEFLVEDVDPVNQPPSFLPQSLRVSEEYNHNL